MKIFRVLFLILTFFNFLFAQAVLKAPSSFTQDEPVVFTLETIGNNAKFPQITKIENYKVQVISQNSSVVNFNSNIIERKSKTYQFFPKKDITIPSFTFEIEGKEFKTKAQKVLMEKIKKTKSKYADFAIEVNKDEVFVGEEFRLKLTFKYRKDLRVDALGLADINFENFWYKAIDANSKRYEQGNFIYQELEFLMFAQKQGELYIKPLRIDMQVIDNSMTNFSFLGNGTTIYKIYSNDLTIKAKALPQKLTLIGDFDLSASVDKTVVNQADAISLKLEVKGFGNIDDLEDFKLNLPSATVYENKPEIKTKVENGKFYGTYSKVFSILPNEDLEIPSFILEYFDKNTKQKVVKKTQKFKISVKQKSLEKQQLIKPEIAKEVVQKVVVTKTSLKEKIVFFLLGFMVCLLIFGLYVYVIKSKQKKAIDEIPLLKQIKKANSKDELIKILVPKLNQNSNLDELIFTLEKVESKEQFKALKKDILTLAKTINKGQKNETSSTILD